MHINFLLFSTMTEHGKILLSEGMSYLLHVGVLNREDHFSLSA